MSEPLLILILNTTPKTMNEYGWALLAIIAIALAIISDYLKWRDKYGKKARKK